MQDIDFLEHGGGAFHLRRGGVLIEMPDPRAEHYQWVLAVLSLEDVPGTPNDIPIWLHDMVFHRWRAAYDLPEFKSAQRLAYLVDNYRSGIASDLYTYAHLDLGQLWRARRWTLLLDIIDRLPAHSWYASAVSMDEDHARMMAEALIAADKKDPEAGKKRGPSLTTWTPEVAALTNLYDAVRSVQYAIIATNSEKPPAPPEPADRPVTPLETAMKRAEYERKKAAHEALVARVLPHKTRGNPPVH